MATRAILTPLNAEFPATNFPALTFVNTRPVLAFDASTAETCYWSLKAPQGITGTLTLVVQYIMASATTGKVDFEVAIEAISDGDTVDLDATSSFATVNTITAPTVPGTAGHIDEFTCTLTNNDSITAGDYVRISLTRDAGDATNDTAAGDCYVLNAELRDSL
jgi:hypothetical protein